MSVEHIVKKWFAIWDQGNIQDLPLADNFTHTSPYGTVPSKQAYLDIVDANKSLFLDNHLDIHESIYESDRACIRYTMTSPTHNRFFPSIIGPN